MDRVQVRRLAAQWATDVGQANVQASIDLRPSDLVYQLWVGELDLTPLCVVSERSCDLAAGLSARLIAVGCGHVLEVRDASTSAVVSEVVASVERNPETSPVAEHAIGGSQPGQTHVVDGLRVRTAIRVADLNPGRTRWLASIMADPGLARRSLVVLASDDTGQPRVVLFAPPNTGRVHAAHAFPREGKLVLTETTVQRVG